MSTRKSKGIELALKQLVLLPGMDGTGLLFGEFCAALSPELSATTVSFPTGRFLSYTELLPLVNAATPKGEAFAILAESFSTPLALAYAATNPPNLAAVVICAGFIRNPIGRWSVMVRPFVRPSLLGLTPPRWFLEFFLVGKNAPLELIHKIQAVLKDVAPEVLSRRLQAVLDCDSRDDLTRAAIPILYLQGTNDRLLTESCRKDISLIRPDVAFAVIPAPHLILQREPQRAANLILAFIQRLAV